MRLEQGGAVGNIAAQRAAAERESRELGTTPGLVGRDTLAYGLAGAGRAARGFVGPQKVALQPPSPKVGLTRRRDDGHLERLDLEGTQVELAGTLKCTFGIFGTRRRKCTRASVGTSAKRVG